ncbi:MAG: nitrite reductase small subunit [Mycobacterium sp.]|jgi:nitrite reductase (NADH) small subunit|nr:nitrite reductase small subunit [Mycobacterium sp.]MDT5311279.1 nitrite reductase small subunit [Mycobacterium sp.]
MSEITVGNVDEIPVGEGRTFAVHGEQIAVYRMRDGSLRAIGAVCPHRGGPLADGLTDHDVVVCPLHGLAYDLRTGAETTGTGPGVCSHPVSAEHDGSIRLTLECA